MEAPIMTNHPDESDLPQSDDGRPIWLPSKHVRPEERRGWTRFSREPGMDYAWIVAPESLVGPVEVLDESLRGLGLVINDARSYHVGLALEIAYAGSIYRAQVRHITLRDDGRFAIGLLCHGSTGQVADAAGGD
jgi:hypothetical protein